MAYYEYKCAKCGNKFIMKRTFEEYDQRPTPKCPKCGAGKVQQLFGSVHVKTSKKS